MNFIYEYAKSLYRLIGISNRDLKRKREKFFNDHDNIDFFNIPIFIISFNRLSYISNIIHRLKEMGYTNIKIIDNGSTYKPLLEYYKNIDCEVFMLDGNYGHMAFWKCTEFEKYRNDLYVVTDPDISPIEECPNDFLKVFYSYLKRYPRINKVGFSLKIDDIPEDAPLHDDVLRWERAYNKFKIPFLNAYTADIDTTLALYLPDSLNKSRHFITAIRTGKPYQARHLPWYKRKEDITEEDIFYENNKTNGFWDLLNGHRSQEGTHSSWG